MRIVGRCDILNDTTDDKLVKKGLFPVGSQIIGNKSWVNKYYSIQLNPERCSIQEISN